jgi:cytoskeleton protein RodZ
VTRPEAEIAELPTDPGARLRRQREIGGITGQQVAERLNLDAGVVAALEEGDYAALGAPVFVRGHLRRYAALVGLPGEEILGAYDRSRTQLAQPTLVPRSREEMAPTRSPIVSQRRVAAALALLAVVGVAAYLGEYGLRLPGTADGGGTGVAEGPIAGSTLVAPGLAGKGATAVPAPEGESSAVAVPAGQVALVFGFTEDSWIEVYDGARHAVLYDLGKAGTERAVAGVPPLSVTLGNAPGVTLSVNGRRATVPSPASGETVARFSVGPDGPQR